MPLRYGVIGESRRRCSESNMVVPAARLVVLDLDLLAQAENLDTQWWVWLDAKKRATEDHKGPVAVDEASL